MDSTESSTDDPFADIAPPDWDDLPSHEEVMAMPTGRPSPPPVYDESVGPPPLPPSVGGPEETQWSVEGRSRPELAALIEAAPPVPSSITDAAEPSSILSGTPAPEPVGGSSLDQAPDEVAAVLEIPPEYWGERPVEPEPDADDEPIIDLSGRDTAGLVSNIGGLVLWAAGLGAAWYLLTRQPDSVVSPDTWPTPEATWDALVELGESADARTTVRETAQRLAAALAVGGLVGVAVGSITGRNRIVRNLARPGVAIFRVVSPLLLLYFLFAWGETGWWVSWAPAAVGVATLTAWSSDRALSKPPPRLTTISGPEVVRGIRASVLLAWTLVFATELALGLDGIFPAMASTTGEMPRTVAWLAVAAVAALLVEATLRMLERIVARG